MLAIVSFAMTIYVANTHRLGKMQTQIVALSRTEYKWVPVLSFERRLYLHPAICDYVRVPYRHVLQCFGILTIARLVV